MAAMIYEDPLHSLTGIGIVLAIGCAYWTSAFVQRRRGVVPAA
jgi:hypothetical protein